MYSVNNIHYDIYERQKKRLNVHVKENKKELNDLIKNMKLTILFSCFILSITLMVIWLDISNLFIIPIALSIIFISTTLLEINLVQTRKFRIDKVKKLLRKINKYIECEDYNKIDNINNQINELMKYKHIINFC